MKKTAERVALVAQICITVIFVTVAVLGLCGVVDLKTESDNGFAIVIMAVMAAAYVGLSIYMIYMHFSENAVLKQVLLYSYSDSTVKATARVVKRIAVQASRVVEGVKLKSIQIRPDDKFGLKMRVVIAIKSNLNAEQCTDMLRMALAESFKTVLGLKFSAIDFKITSMKTDVVPDIKRIKEVTQALADERKENDDYTLAGPADTAPALTDSPVDSDESTGDIENVDGDSADNADVADVVDADDSADSGDVADSGDAVNARSENIVDTLNDDESTTEETMEAARRNIRK